MTLDPRSRSAGPALSREPSPQLVFGWAAPLRASSALERRAAAKLPRLTELMNLFHQRHPEVIEHIAPADNGFIGYNRRGLLSVVNKGKLERIRYMRSTKTSFLVPTGFAPCRAVT